jgi:two-component system, NtrC family, response regulator HydG
MARILLVDDDPQSLSSTARILELAGHQVCEASDGQQALTLVKQVQSGETEALDAVISDVRMPKLSGIEFLRAVKMLGDSTPVILMTAFGEVGEAVWAMKLGAVDFLTKPFKRQALLDALEAALRRKRPQGEVRTVPGSGLQGNSPAIGLLRARLQQVAPTDATVLLRGPSGSGKELVAREIHRMSRRASGPFVALNCASIPEHLIESELFGHEKGAFTGANDSKMGLFEAAGGGTLFLDEIGDMPVTLQVSLLRALQEREVRRLGANHPRRIDVRVISATHRDLQEAVATGKFREDLLFRLEVVGLQVPSLRERPEDVLLLAREFLSQAGVRHGKNVRELTPEVERAFLAYDWPGNVRELMNAVERAVIFAQTERVDLGDLPPQFALQNARGVPARETAISIPLGTTLREVEELLIRKTLEATDGDKGMTAKLLGINSRTIYRKLEKNQPKERPADSTAADSGDPFPPDGTPNPPLC